MEWLDSLGYSKGEAKDYNSDEMIIINQALHEVVQRNKLNIAILLLDYGASMSTWSIYKTFGKVWVYNNRCYYS